MFLAGKAHAVLALVALAPAVARAEGQAESAVAQHDAQVANGSSTLDPRAAARTAQPAPAAPAPEVELHESPEPLDTLAEPGARKHHGRTTIELAAGLAAGVGWYWLNKDFNKRDWEFGWSESWDLRLTDPLHAIRFDDNVIDANIVDHPFAGALAYQLARTNDIGVLGSFLYTVAGSTFWEYVIEWKERVSLNDQITTPFGGMVIGETFAQLGHFFDSGADTWVHDALSIGLWPTRRLHHVLDGTRPTRGRSVDGLGLTRDIWHEFSFSAGVAATAPSDADLRTDADLRLRTEIVNVPTYGKPGQTARFLHDGNFSEMNLGAAFGPEGVLDLSFDARMLVAGYYRQDTERRGRGLHGYSLLLGAASAFELRYHDKARGSPDVAGVCDLLGPTVQASFHYGRLRLRASAAAYADFAIVRAYALDEYRDHGITGLIKSTLRYRDYYYALGVTARGRAVATIGRAALGAEATWTRLDSVEGLDRFQEEITHDVDAVDRRLLARVWLAYHAVRERLGVVVVAERRTRSGDMESVSVERTEIRFLGSAIVRF